MTCPICETKDCRHYFKLRTVRDGLLKDSDKYVLPDLWESYTATQKKEVSTYRQALRALPATVDSPMSFGSKLPPKPSWVFDSDTYTMAD